MSSFVLNKLAHKWLLLDANFFIDFYRYRDAAEFKTFVQEVHDAGAEMVTSQHVVYEFLSGSNTFNEFNLQKNFLDLFVKAVLKDDAEIIDFGIRISSIYKNKKIKECNAGITDCLLSGQLKRFDNQIALLTRNIKDFPLLIHKRLGVRAIDVGSQVLTFGFIQFDQNAFRNVQDDFLRT